MNRDPFHMLWTLYFVYSINFRTRIYGHLAVPYIDYTTIIVFKKTASLYDG